MSFLCKFVVVQTVSGQPDPFAYPAGVAPGTEYNNGSGRVVYVEVQNVEAAALLAVPHEEGPGNPIWEAYCPPSFKGSKYGGLDVIYIGPLSNDEVAEITDAVFRVLYHMHGVSEVLADAIAVYVLGAPPEKPVRRPTDAEVFIHGPTAEGMVEQYRWAFGAAVREVIGEGV